MKIKRFFKARGSLILTILNCIGVGATGVAAGIGTWKAKDAVAAKKEELGRELTSKELVKTMAPFYIPAGSIASVTIASSIGAHALDAREKATLTAAALTSMDALRTINQKCIEDKRAEKIKDVCANEGDEAHSLVHLYLEPMTGITFEATDHDILMAEMQLNKEISRSGIATYDDFLSSIGIKTYPPTQLMWDICNQDLDPGDCWVEIYTLDEETSTGTKFKTINFTVEPRFCWELGY